MVVNLILNAYPGSTAEAINYPACGGQASCGGVSYANSVVQGVSAAANAVNSFNTRCPNTQLVLVGYSQVNTPPVPLARHDPPDEGIGRSNLRRRFLRRRRYKRGPEQHCSTNSGFCHQPNQSRDIPGRSPPYPRSLIQRRNLSGFRGECFLSIQTVSFVIELTNLIHSLRLVLLALSVHPRRKSNLTAMQPTHTAAMATTPTPTKVMVPSMVRQLLHSSRASSAVHRQVLLHQQVLHQPAARAVAELSLIMVSVVVLAIQGLRLAQARTHARWQMRTILNVCEGRSGGFLLS